MFDRRVVLPACHVLVKNLNFKLLYFFQFVGELHKTHIFAKFGMENLFMDKIIHLIHY